MNITCTVGKHEFGEWQHAYDAIEIRWCQACRKCEHRKTELAPPVVRDESETETIKVLEAIAGGANVKQAHLSATEAQIILRMLGERS